jgi:hypothetical protein
MGIIQNPNRNHVLREKRNFEADKAQSQMVSKFHPFKWMHCLLEKFYLTDCEITSQDTCMFNKYLSLSTAS